MSKFSGLDIDDVVDFLIGFDEDKEVDCEITEREELCYEKFRIDYNLIHKVVDELLSSIDLGISPLTSEPFIGITKTTPTYKEWIAKKNILSLFIGSVLQWMQVEDITEDKRRVEREITSKGVKEYTITVLKH